MAVRALAVIGGPLNGQEAQLRGALGWLDNTGRAHSTPGPGRWLYQRKGDRLEFAGRGARRCDGCGATLDADERDEPPETCQLCGARVDSLDADSRAILMGVPDRKDPAVQALPNRLPAAPLIGRRAIPDCDGCGQPSYSTRPGDAPWAQSPDPRGGAVCSALCELKVAMRVFDGVSGVEAARRLEAFREWVELGDGLDGVDVVSVKTALETVAGHLAETSPTGIGVELADGDTRAVRWAALVDAEVITWDS